MNLCGAVAEQCRHDPYGTQRETARDHHRRECQPSDRRGVAPRRRPQRRTKVASVRRDDGEASNAPSGLGARFVQLRQRKDRGRAQPAERKGRRGSPTGRRLSRRDQEGRLDRRQIRLVEITGEAEAANIGTPSRRTGSALEGVHPRWVRPRAPGDRHHLPDDRMLARHRTRRNSDRRLHRPRVDESPRAVAVRLRQRFESPIGRRALPPDGSPPRLEGVRTPGAPRSTGGADSIHVSAVEVDSKECEAAPVLAERFGAPIFEPTWWPADIEAVTYVLDVLPSRVRYRIGSIRRGGRPICVIGTAGQEGHPGGHWSRPPELEPWRGLSRNNGDHVHSVVRAEQQTIHLIGYASLDEVVHAVKSFHRVFPLWA